MSLIIAIDGPAASGKGTLARRLAQRLDLAHLDTGALYRAVAHHLLQQHQDPGDEKMAAAAAQALQIDNIDPIAIRGEAVGKAASIVSRHAAVRQALLARQRQFAAHPPGGKSGAVLDGRDIGTVVCPDAQVKIFLTAAPEIRAKRRLLELETRGEQVDFEALLAEIKARDAQDRNRPLSPLKPAEDAHLLDSSELDIEAALEAALAIVEAAKSKRPQ